MVQGWQNLKFSGLIMRDKGVSLAWDSLEIITGGRSEATFGSQLVTWVQQQPKEWAWLAERVFPTHGKQVTKAKNSKSSGGSPGVECLPMTAGPYPSQGACGRCGLDQWWGASALEAGRWRSIGGRRRVKERENELKVDEGEKPNWVNSEVQNTQRFQVTPGAVKPK